MKICILATATAIIFFVSCKKNNAEPILTTVVNVVNAVPAAGNIKVDQGMLNFSFKASTDQIIYGAMKQYGFLPGPNLISAVTSADTTRVLFKGELAMKAPVYTLYLVGGNTAPDTMFREEKGLPYLATVDGPVNDSSMYVRFVNLSPNSSPVSINLLSIVEKEFSNISYKSVGQFKKYDARANAPTYTFEVRDALTNELLLTKTLNPSANRFRTLSFIIRGLVGITGSNGLGVSQLNYLN